MATISLDDAEAVIEDMRKIVASARGDVDAGIPLAGRDLLERMEAMCERHAIALLTLCTGEAHRDPHIDHCGVCAPRWGYCGEAVRVEAKRTQGAPPPITPVEFDEADFAVAERIARRLGYRQIAYTSTSALWGLFCLPDRASQRRGCIIKTREFGLMFVQDTEDMLMTDERR